METDKQRKPSPIITSKGFNLVPPVMVPGNLPELDDEDIELLHECPPVAFRAGSQADDSQPADHRDKTG